MASVLLKALSIGGLLAGVLASGYADGPGLKVKHEGQPTGEIKSIDGIETYHAYPPDKSTDNAILFLTDIYGIKLPQNKLLADSLAAAGYLVVLPDYFKGEPIPVDPTGFDRAGWQSRHPAAEVTAITAATIKYMRNTLKVKRIGAVGYCFGGKYVARFTARGQGVDAGFVAHPSAVEAAEWEAIDAPLSIAAAQTDQSFNSTVRYQTEERFVKKNATFQINVYAGTQHGFAVRVDLGNRRQVFGKESAFFQAVRWFDEWLKAGSSKPAAKQAYAEKGHDLRTDHDFKNSY